ncbi:MAG TPA: MltA domain-containing protein [Caulobacterales bacterium]|nr:MltA domain-containing protein [Caulobacterales bacterium]
MRPYAWALSCAALASACATTPPPSRPIGGPTQPAAAFALEAARFSDLPGWSTADLAPALTAFQRACATRSLRAANSPMADNGRYGGAVADWQPACAAASQVAPGGERAFFESFFTPALVRGTGEARLTAYYEPVIEVRRQQEPGFTEPLLRKPDDMITVDLAAFAEAYDNDTLRGAPRRLTGKLNGATVVPYPKRAEIVARPGQAFAWANPADVYNLQVQGSGRISFPEGVQERASYAAQNGYRWSSALTPLRDAGQLPGGATWANFKLWVNAHTPEEARTALSADPSYVFFQEELIADPGMGPRGASGANLTAMGSIAVDPEYHPYGALVYVDGVYDGAAFDHLLVAQDTGGAIRRGPLRGDVFFGSGPEAGLAAERMNAPARWWTLLPKGAPIA